MSIECILCYENEEIFGVGVCNHGPICFKCIIKCRIKMDQKTCPICKLNLDQIILQRGQLNFQTFDLSKLQKYDEQSGIFFIDQSIKNELQNLNQFQCWIKNCKEQSFNTIGFLKRHLKEKHSRFLCDICVEHKTALLNEQKLYSNVQLEKHLKNGDFDDDHNLFFFHPYCSFCSKHFYNEEQFLKHMQREHMSCHVCGDQQKFRFYKDYQALQIHFKMTHYLCQEEECLKKGFIVFKYAAEKELHDTKTHGTAYEIKQNRTQKNLSKFNFHNMTGFHYEQDNFRQNKNQNEEIIQIKDNEGLDFEYQFISQRKIHYKENKHVENQVDKPIDFRDFYQIIYDQEDQTPLEYFQEMWQSSGEEIVYQKKNQDYQLITKKEKYVKQEYRKNEEEVQLPKKEFQKNQEEIFIEDIKLIKYSKLFQMDIDKFDYKLKKLVNKDQFDDFATLRAKYFKNQITALEFFQQFIKILGQKQAFQLFPFFITAIPNNETIKELDQAYYEELNKLKRKNNSLILKSKTILELLNNLLLEIEINIKQRIMQGEIDVNYQKYEKTRLIQLFEILKRVETLDFGKLKLCSNFGVPIELIQIIKHEIFFINQNEIQQKLHEIDRDQLIQFMIYIYFSIQILTNQNPLDDSKKFHKNILMPFLDKNLDIKNKYFKKKQNDSSESEHENEKKVQISLFGKKNNIIQPEPKKIIQPEPKKIEIPQQIDQQVQKVQLQEIQKPIEVKKANKIIQADKFEFPGLGNEDSLQNSEVIQQKQDKQEQNDWIHKKNQNPFIDYERGTIKSQKEIQQQFPGLMPEEQSQKNIKNQQKKAQDKNNQDSDEEIIQTKKSKRKQGQNAVLGFY